jgi:magnesium transporter
MAYHPFLSEMLTATAMGHFQSELDAALVLSLFVPLIISSGGNSGSQAATLIIRAMALNELTPKRWWYVMRREIFSGLTLESFLEPSVDQNYDLAGISLGKL